MIESTPAAGDASTPSPADRAVVACPWDPSLDGDNDLGYLVIMIRTQISLSKEEYRAAKIEARRQGISLAELLRRSLRSVLPADESRPWMRYAGMVATGNRDSSREIDEVVYGHKD